MTQLLDRLQEAASDPEANNSEPSGFLELNSCGMEFLPGDVATFTATNSDLKTSWLIGTTLALARKSPQPILIFCSPEREAELARAFVSSVGAIDRNRLINCQLADDEWPRLTQAVDVLCALSISVYLIAGPTAEVWHAVENCLPVFPPMGPLIMDFDDAGTSFSGAEVPAAGSRLHVDEFIARLHRIEIFHQASVLLFCSRAQVQLPQREVRPLTAMRDATAMSSMYVEVSRARRAFTGGLDTLAARYASILGGVELACGPGWSGPLERFLRDLSNLLERRSMQGPPNVERGDPSHEMRLLQVKEKLGGLRVYLSKPDAEVRCLIRRAEESCAVTCDQCGTVGRLRVLGGLLATRCESHAMASK